jgi:serine/threonine-protein kinase
VNPNSYQQQGHHAAGVTPGQILLGKYRVERVLGMGGMGVVVAATHVTLEERVAIKFLLPDALGSQETVARFLREARAAVRIKSEHVARVTDVGTLENGAPYMIMEYLDGADLAVFTQRRGALPIEDAVEYVLQACEALAEAHALGIVHRDLKPANLFVATRADGTPSVKVLDFGISKVGGASGTDLGMTKTTTIMGSPLYMSPEQMASTRDVDARTDIWALGAILYELLTGRVPFHADTITQLCTMILQQPPPPLRNLRPDAPQGLQDIIQRCLAKDRNHRYQNVAEFASALTPYAPRRARISIERVGRVIDSAGLGSSRPPFEGTLPVADAYGPTSTAWDDSGLPKRSNATVIAIAVGAILGVAGLATAAVVLLRSPQPEAAPAPMTEPATAPVTTVAPPAPTADVAPVVTPEPTPSTAPHTVAPSPPVAKGSSGRSKATARGTRTPEPAVPPKPPPPPEPREPTRETDLLNDRK